ncbi:LAME_0G00166g1_1 [Lachancea meyersii CBS 8951]|uniref:LAME_0G00166g1_1 n=1 Tax=Lachancea meyersii CBS 8951 TaxID=1266667 RepID=A0A1G4K4K6_9SACH|nr:LAME_0G00166g1_1 [Lachancea meyersii CBS 8951]
MKSAKPSFKVALTNDKKKVCKPNRRFPAKNRPSKKKVCFEQNFGVNLYMTYTRPEVIPRTPQIILNLGSLTHSSNIQINKAKSKIQSSGLDTPIEKELANDTIFKYDKEKSPKKRLNPFIGFRSYYASYVKGKIKQQDLSVLLSNYWTSNGQIHKTWEFFTQHYNKNKTDMCFVDWLEKNYNCEHTEKPAHKQRDEEPYIEDIFSNTEELLKRYTSKELIDMTRLQTEHQDFFNNFFPFEDQHNSNGYISSLIESDDLVYI